MEKCLIDATYLGGTTAWSLIPNLFFQCVLQRCESVRGKFLVSAGHDATWVHSGTIEIPLPAFGALSVYRHCLQRPSLASDRAALRR